MAARPCSQPCARWSRRVLHRTSVPTTGRRSARRCGSVCAGSRGRLWRRCGNFTASTNCAIRARLFPGICGSAWSGPAPAFQPILRRDELPPEIIALEGFSEILSSYYQEQKIGQLWRQVQPVYNREVERLHDSLSQIVFVASAYLREI